MASGDTLIVLTPLHNIPPDADFATLDTFLTASADEPDDNVDVLDFDDGATNEFASFKCFMPNHYAGGGLTITITWSSGATSGVARWEIALKSVSDDADDSDAKAYAAQNSVNLTTASAAGEVDYGDITFTDGSDMDSVAKNEMFWLTINRDSADTGADTLTGDGELHMIVIKET